MYIIFVDWPWLNDIYTGDVNSSPTSDALMCKLTNIHLYNLWQY